MRKIEIKYEGGEGEVFSVALERRRAEDLPWELGARATQQNGVKTYMLEAGERLVIEPWGATVEMVWDRNQNAAMPRAAFESQPNDAEKRATEDARQQEVRDTNEGRVRDDRVGDRAADQAREEALQKQKERSEERAKEEALKGSKVLPSGTKIGDPVKPIVPPTTEGAKPLGTVTPVTPPHPAGGMTAAGPATGGQSSTDVKNV